MTPRLVGSPEAIARLGMVRLDALVARHMLGDRGLLESSADATVRERAGRALHVALHVPPKADDTVWMSAHPIDEEGAFDPLGNLVLIVSLPLMNVRIVMAFLPTELKNLLIDLHGVPNGRRH